MNRNKIIMVTSCKGGVGKSTVCANLGLALAKRGKRVLLCDCDFGMKCLDILMGREDAMPFSFFDAISGRVATERIFLSDERRKDLIVCLAPDEKEGESITVEQFISFLSEASSILSPDFILLDTPGDLSHPFHLATSVAGRGIVVTTHNPTALRAAEKTALLLDQNRVTPSLIINFYEPERAKLIKKGVRSGAMEMVDRTSAGLLGVIPFSDTLALSQEQGLLADRAGKRDFLPFRNIAARMCGENVPLFTGYPHRLKMKKYIQ